MPLSYTCYQLLTGGALTDYSFCRFFRISWDALYQLSDCLGVCPVSAMTTLDYTKAIYQQDCLHLDLCRLTFVIQSPLVCNGHSSRTQPRVHTHIPFYTLQQLVTLLPIYPPKDHVGRSHASSRRSRIFGRALQRIQHPQRPEHICARTQGTRARRVGRRIRWVWRDGRQGQGGI